MTTTLESALDVLFGWNFRNSLDQSTTRDVDRLRHQEGITNGTGDNQANEMWHDRRWVTAGSPTDDIDLRGVLTNAFGQTVNFTKIKTIVIENLGVPTDGRGGDEFTPTAGEDLLIGGEGVNPFDDWANADNDAKIRLGSGGLLVLTNPLDGWDVTASTADLLRVANGGTTDIVYKIILEGIKE